MTRRTLSVAVLVGALLLLLIIASEVFLLLFASLLLGVFVHGGGHFIARRFGLKLGTGIAIFLVSVVLAFAAAFTGMAPSVGEQVSQLAEEVPRAFGQLQERLESTRWGRQLLDRVSPKDLLSEENQAMATSAVTSTFGALASFVLILFIGIYGSITPGLYKRGVLALLEPSARPRGDVVIQKCAHTLRQWLTAQLLSMTVVGTLTAGGLWIAGIPLAFGLGLIAALLAFIPNIGPVLAATPAVLLALPDGMTTVLTVIAVYVVVQTLESYFITPMIQKERANLAPALVIGSQLLFGFLFGILGLALATPLIALLLTLVRELYVKDYLEAPEGSGIPLLDLTHQHSR